MAISWFQATSPYQNLFFKTPNRFGEFASLLAPPASVGRQASRLAKTGIFKNYPSLSQELEISQKVSLPQVAMKF